jgi:hypothetical protein
LAVRWCKSLIYLKPPKWNENINNQIKREEKGRSIYEWNEKIWNNNYNNNNMTTRTNHDAKWRVSMTTITRGA